MRRFDTVLFDLDGTLLDTLEDICGAANHTLRELGYPERTLAEMRRFVGNGAEMQMRRALGAAADEETVKRDEETVAKALALYKPYYAAHCQIKTKPYAGVLELMAALKAEGFRLAVVSNKPDEAVRPLVAKHFGALADIAMGETAQRRRKPAPDMVNDALAALGADKSRAVYVGDSEVDIETARNAGIALRAIISRPNMSTGTTTTKVSASLPPMMKAITMQNMNINGQRIAMRIIIMNDIWTLLTSVVIRVTSEAEENLSIFSNEKLCTRSNISWRRLRAKPVDALAQVAPAMPPQQSDRQAISTRNSPMRTTCSIGALYFIRFTSFAVINGIKVSINASPTIKISVRIVGFLYSLTHPASLFIMCRHIPSRRDIARGTCPWRFSA
mgnify:CR=1 FL=1